VFYFIEGNGAQRRGDKNRVVSSGSLLDHRCRRRDICLPLTVHTDRVKPVAGYFDQSKKEEVCH
jgi:hypothetical protein